MRALFGLVDKVGICISNTTEYYLGAMLAYLELGYVTPLGGPKVCYTDLTSIVQLYACV